MSECHHKHTGSHTIGPSDWRVHCMDCREVLKETPRAKVLRETCPGWEREAKHGHFCKHCQMDAEHHIKVLTARLSVWEATCTGQHGSQMPCYQADTRDEHG